MKFIFLFIILFNFSFSNDEVIKGKTYYIYLLKDKLGYNGAVFSKQHTKKEWEKLFSNQSKELKKELVQKNPQLKSFVYSDKFSKVSPYLKSFCIYYAKDSKQTASCTE